MLLIIKISIIHMKFKLNQLIKLQKKTNKQSKIKINPKGPISKKNMVKAFIKIYPKMLSINC